MNAPYRGWLHYVDEGSGPLGRYLIRNHNFFVRTIIPQAFGDKRKLTPAAHAKIDALPTHARPLAAIRAVLSAYLCFATKRERGCGPRAAPWTAPTPLRGC